VSALAIFFGFAVASELEAVAASDRDAEQTSVDRRVSELYVA
jgi:hypothetical protein